VFTPAVIKVRVKRIAAYIAPPNAVAEHHRIYAHAIS